MEMGRKVCLKKIENITKCQVTFSKRRSSLIKKAHELSVTCDADVAFVTFSPSGRITKFSNQNRIEDVIYRYVNLPADIRYTDIENAQEKLEKLQQLDHIKGENRKLQYLDNQVENLELQIEKRTLELQIMEADLRDYETLPDDQQQEPSLDQLMWCERNLKESLARVIAKKNALAASDPSIQTQPDAQVEMEKQGGSLSYDLRGKDSNLLQECPSANSEGQHLVQLDPWINPYSTAKARESLFQGVIDKQNRTPMIDQSPRSSTYHSSDNIFNKNQGQSSISFVEQENQFVCPMENAYTSIAQPDLMTRYENGIGTSGFSHSSSDIQPPTLERNTTLPVDEYLFPAFAAKELNFNSSEFPQFEIEMETSKESNDQMLTASDQFNIEITGDSNINIINNTTLIDNRNNHNSGNSESGRAIKDYSPAIEEFQLPPPIPSLSDNFSIEEFLEDFSPWTAQIQESESREWDELIPDNLNLEDLKNFLD